MTTSENEKGKSRTLDRETVFRSPQRENDSPEKTEQDDAKLEKFIKKSPAYAVAKMIEKRLNPPEYEYVSPLPREESEQTKRRTEAAQKATREQTERDIERTESLTDIADMLRASAKNDRRKAWREWIAFLAIIITLIVTIATYFK